MHSDARSIEGSSSLYYQPILSASSGEIVALECLVRWNDPTYSLIQPEKFIGVAEQSGLIVDLGEWVIGEACARYARWRDAGIAPGRIGINVSGQQFREQRLACSVITTVEELKIDRSFVEALETTPEAHAITTAILAMAKKLNLRVVAEGVETEFQVEFLRRESCDELQGYLYSRPVSTEGMTVMLRNGISRES